MITSLWPLEKSRHATAAEIESLPIHVHQDPVSAVDIIERSRSLWELLETIPGIDGRPDPELTQLSLRFANQISLFGVVTNIPDWRELPDRHGEPETLS